MSEGHSPLGASGAKRWLLCPGSFQLIEAANAGGAESEYARLGTAAHALAERCINENREAWEFTGERIDGFEIGEPEPDEGGDWEEGAEKVHKIDPTAVQVYVDYARNLAEKADWSAAEYTFGKTYKPNAYFWGTADFAAMWVENGKTVYEVVDLKFGEGVAVDPVANPQLMYYAWGFLNEFGVDFSKSLDDEIRLTISQPRYAGKTPLQTWTTTVGHIFAWAKETLLPGMQAAIAGGPLNEGEHCGFCPAKDSIVCPKLKDNMRDIAAQSNAPGCTDAELDDLYLKSLTAKMLIRAIETQMLARLQNGSRFENAKLRHKRTLRVWKEGTEDKLKTELGDDAYTRKLKTPAAIEKLSKKWKAFSQENAFLPEANGYTLVPATDSAPAADPVGDLNREFAHYSTVDVKDF